MRSRDPKPLLADISILVEQASGQSEIAEPGADAQQAIGRHGLWWPLGVTDTIVIPQIECVAGKCRGQILEFEPDPFALLITYLHDLPKSREDTPQRDGERSLGSAFQTVQTRGPVGALRFARKASLPRPRPRREALPRAQAFPRRVSAGWLGRRYLGLNP